MVALTNLLEMLEQISTWLKTSSLVIEKLIRLLGNNSFAPKTNRIEIICKCFTPISASLVYNRPNKMPNTRSIYHK